MTSVKSIIRQHPLLRKIINKLNPYNLNVPPGHFYSPVPNLTEIKERELKLFETYQELAGINLNDIRQLELLEALKNEYPKLPFTDETNPAFRYSYNNEMYSHSSGALLFCMIQYLKPKHIIEVGSGYTSALMLDTNDIFFNGQINFTFIEPYPIRLKELMNREDLFKERIIEQKLEEVDPAIFENLEANDILFIDSTHVSKIGSDVNSIIFDILPKLKKGVYIHFHDIFYPFEYPKEWVLKGIYWNEAYLLRAFLQFNNTFSIQFFNTYLINKFKGEFAELPLMGKNIGGCIWLKKEE